MIAAALAALAVLSLLCCFVGASLFHSAYDDDCPLCLGSGRLTATLGAGRPGDRCPCRDGSEA